MPKELSPQVFKPFTPVTALSPFDQQVSHHPPISAFYVECPSRRISFNGYIHTKSSFLGMSIAAHMVGQGKVSLQVARQLAERQ